MVMRATTGVGGAAGAAAAALACAGSGGGAVGVAVGAVEGDGVGVVLTRTFLDVAARLAGERPLSVAAILASRRRTVSAIETRKPRLTPSWCPGMGDL
jgi:hypothetical protein